MILQADNLLCFATRFTHLVQLSCPNSAPFLSSHFFAFSIAGVCARTIFQKTRRIILFDQMNQLIHNHIIDHEHRRFDQPPADNHIVNWRTRTPTILPWPTLASLNSTPRFLACRATRGSIFSSALAMNQFRIADDLSASVCGTMNFCSNRISHTPSTNSIR